MKTLVMALLIGLLLTPMRAQAQGANKVQLDDVNIKGEANKLNGFNMASRARNNLDGRILMRKNFRERSLEDLPQHFKSEELAQK